MANNNLYISKFKSKGFQLVKKSIFIRMYIVNFKGREIIKETNSKCYRNKRECNYVIEIHQEVEESNNISNLKGYLNHLGTYGWYGKFSSLFEYYGIVEA